MQPQYRTLAGTCSHLGERVLHTLASEPASTRPRKIRTKNGLSRFQTNFVCFFFHASQSDLAGKARHVNELRFRDVEKGIASSTQDANA